MRTPAAPAIETRLFDPSETLHAPYLLDVEIAQVLRRYEAGGDIGNARARQALADIAMKDKSAISASRAW